MLSYPHCNQFLCCPLTPNHHSQLYFSSLCFPEIKGYDSLHSPQRAAVVTRLGSRRGYYHMICKHFKFNVRHHCFLKAPSFPTQECFKPMSLHRTGPSIMFLASPPRPHLSDTSTSFFRISTPLVASRLLLLLYHAECFHFFKNLYLSHLQCSKRAWPSTNK